MYPDDDSLRKRLRAKFADYAPEPTTPWHQIDARLPRRPTPFRRWRLPVAVFVGLLVAGTVGY